MERDGARGRAALVVVGVVHAALVALLVSVPSELAQKPIRNTDYTPHYYAARHAAEHVRNTGVYWGYDPYWMAGYPEGHVSTVDNKLFCTLLLVAPAGWEPLFFNGVILLVLLSVPWLSALASRIGDGSWHEAAGAALVATVVTFSVPACVVFWSWGGISFFLVSVLMVPLAAGLAVTLIRQSLFSCRGALGTLAALFAVFTHPLAGPLLALLLLPVLWSGKRPLARRVGELAFLGAVLILPVLPIIEASAWARDVFQAPDPHKLAGGLEQLRLDWWVYLLRSGDPFFGAGSLLAILPLAIIGSLPARADDGRELSPSASVVNRIALFGAAGCAIVTYLIPSLVPRVAVLQPFRFLIPLAFLVCVPAGRGLVRSARRFVERRTLERVFALLAVLIVANAIRDRRSLLVLGHGADRAEVELVEFLEKATTAEDRILVEANGMRFRAKGWLRRYVVIRRFALAPLLIEREFLGYVGTAPFVAHRYTSLERGMLFGNKLSDLREKRFEEILSRFGISWIVGCTGETLGPLRGFSATLEETAPLADCTIFRVREPKRSRFLEGGGEVRARLDRIEVSGASGDRIVLKYHWMPKLRTDPPLPIEEAPQSGAAVGFIAVRPSGTRDFVIRPRDLSEATRALLASVRSRPRERL